MAHLGIREKIDAWREMHGFLQPPADIVSLNGVVEAGYDFKQQINVWRGAFGSAYAAHLQPYKDGGEPGRLVSRFNTLFITLVKLADLVVQCELPLNPLLLCIKDLPPPEMFEPCWHSADEYYQQLLERDHSIFLAAHAKLVNMADTFQQ